MKAVTLVRLDAIRTDGGTQPRAELSDAVVAEYAQALEEDAEFPPLTVYHDGSAHWLADGFHRYFAAKKAGLVSVRCDVRQGTCRDALLYSVGANAAHGIRRNEGDTERAISVLLADSEWAKWDDREIAKRCAAPFETVQSVRARWIDPRQPPLSYVDEHGSTVKLAEEAKPRPVRPSREWPPAFVETVTTLDEEFGHLTVLEWELEKLGDGEEQWWEAEFLRYYAITDGSQGASAEMAGTTSAVVKTHKARNSRFRARMVVADAELHAKRSATGRRYAANDNYPTDVAVGGEE